MRFLFLSLLALCFPGCAGYTLGPIKPKQMTGVKTIAVNSFKNDTLEPRVEVLMADAVIKQIQQDGTYQVVDEKSADAILEGTVEEIERRPARSVRGNVLLTREFTLLLRVKYKVTRRDNGQQLDQRTVTGTTSFFVSGSNPLVADVNQDERQALPLAAEDMAVRLTSMISEGW